MSSEAFLGEIAEITMGQSPSGENCNAVGNGLPLLNGPTEFGTKHPYPVQFTTDPKRLAYPGDLLFCVRGSTTGRMNWSDQTYAIGRGIASIRGRNGYPNSFIRAVIESTLDSLLVQATGSTFPNVTGKLIASLTIPKVTPKTASTIASIIEPLDDRIALLRETNTTLETIAQALFKSWFVDFDPVRAKQEGREPEGMDAETAALFPDSFEESELGLIPKGWKIGKVDNILSRLSSKVRYTKDQITPDGVIPIYEQGAGILLGYHNGPAQFLADKKNPAFIFGDHTCVTHLSCEPFDISQNVIPLKGKDRATLWVYYAIKDKQTFQEYRRHWMELIVKDIVIPTPQICEVYANIVSIFHLKIESNVHQLRTITSIRDTLLPRLISGRLRLPEAETQLEEVGS